MTDLQNYADARLLTPFGENDTRYQVPTALTIGANKDSKNWRDDKRTTTVAELIRHLAQHPEDKKKDGWGFVPGDMVPGRRSDKAVRALYAVVLDCDLDPDLDAVADAMAKSGKCCILYTTFTHLKDKTEIKRDELTKFAPDADHDADLVRRYLTEKKKWPAQLTEALEVTGTEHTTDGIMVVVRHKPLAKIRVVFPLASPFEVKEFVSLGEAKEKWEKIVFAVAESLGVAGELDATCARINQMFYHPRHAAGDEHVTMLCGGNLLNWREVDTSNPYLDAVSEFERRDKKSKSKTEAGKALGKWSRDHAEGFQIAELLREHCEDRIRGNGSTGVEIECPFDDGHSNSGDSDDRACQATNAGDSSAPVFSIKCQHASCRDYTNLDMLAKMIADGWFERELIDSDDFNAIGDGDTEQPNPGADYQAAISNLTPKATDEQIEAAISLCIEAKPSVRALENALKKIGEKTDTSIQTVRKMFKGVNGDKREQVESTSGVVTANGYGGALAFVRRAGGIPKGVTYDKETDQIHPTYRNALLLVGSEGWDLGYNELSQNYGMRGQVKYPWPDHLGFALNDAIRREIRLYMLRRWGVTFKTEDIYEATMTLARRNTFNPVCDYLNEVEAQWDGESRVDGWLETYLGVKVTNKNAAYVRAIGKIVLVAAVKRARDPGCKFDEILILEGDQGAGKSTALRILGGEWFGDANLGDLKNKSAPMKLRGVWIHEIAELTALNRAETNELKEFTSQQIDRYRLPYAKSEDDFPRRCIFIGTVNPGGGAYLVDLTGNRRFWPVACSKADTEDSDGGEIDLEALARDRDQILAEAAMMESRGVSIRLDPSLYKAAKGEQDARLADDPWREILIEHLDGVKPTKEGTPRVTSNVLLTVALEIPKDRLAQPHMKRLKGVMATIPNWKYKESVRVDGERTAGYEYAGA